MATKFINSRIVEKIFVNVPQRYEAFVITLQNTKDFSKITLAELLNALQAQEQWSLMRQDRIAKGSLPAKHQDYGKEKKKYYKKNQAASNEITTSQTTDVYINRFVFMF